MATERLQEPDPLELESDEDVASTVAPAASRKVAERNAFTTLMSPKKTKPTDSQAPPPSNPSSDPTSKTLFLGREGLGAYIADPASFPPSRVIYHNDDFVVINDLFPKSAVHLLVLPRDVSKMHMHPYDAFLDPAFRASVHKEVCKVRSLAAKELRRRHGRFSAKEKAREQALDGGEQTLPEGRDWEKEIMTGIHAGPSMNHVHVHVMSRDMHSECMRHRKHYNSFNTPFLVPVEDFPLDKMDERMHPGRQAYLDRDLVCWRCGQNFRRKFKALKEHLDEEFEGWRKV